MTYKITLPHYFQENTWLLFAISGPLLAVAVVVIMLIYFPTHPGLHRISIDGETIYASVADTEESRELGLGGRETMPDDEGMLFVFEAGGNHPFWMKDMRFALDIVWLADDGTIEYIQGDVVPATYPEVFGPPKPTGKYVLELNGGYCAEHDIKVGDKVAL